MWQPSEGGWSWSRYNSPGNDNFWAPASSHFAGTSCHYRTGMLSALLSGRMLLDNCHNGKL